MLKMKALIVAILLLTFAANAQQNDWATATPKSVGIDAKLRAIGRNPAQLRCYSSARSGLGNDYLIVNDAPDCRVPSQ